MTREEPVQAGNDGEEGAEGCHHPEKFCLYSVADSTPTLGKFDFNNDNAKWDIKPVK